MKKKKRFTLPWRPFESIKKNNVFLTNFWCNPRNLPKKSKICISSLDGGNILIGSSSSRRLSIAEAEGGEHTSQKPASVSETENSARFLTF